MRLVPKFLRRSEAERTGTMTVVEHLEELRRRLIIAFIAVGLRVAIVGWFLYPYVHGPASASPFCDYVTRHPEVRPPAGCDLVFTGLVDAFIVKMKIVVFLGLVVALPVVLYQLWAFIVPGLTERRAQVCRSRSSRSATFLFFLGAAFAYWTLPKALDFLLGFAGAGVAPLLTADRYVGFVDARDPRVRAVVPVPGAAGVPGAGRRPGSRRLRSWRRYAILVIAVFSAVITPSSDPYTMLAMMIPMYVFYEAAIIIGRLMKQVGA